MKVYLNHFENLTPTWPLRNPYWKGAKSSKIWSKYFLTYNEFKTINNSFSSKWHLSTSSTTSSITLHVSSIGGTLSVVFVWDSAEQFCMICKWGKSCPLFGHGALSLNSYTVRWLKTWLSLSNLGLWYLNYCERDDGCDFFLDNWPSNKQYVWMDPAPGPGPSLVLGPL